MRNALLILAMPIVLLMIGCAEEDASRDPQVNGSAMVKGMPIDFGTDDAGDTTRISPYLTRTAVNILNLSGIQTSGFGVFAAHTGLHTYANSSISSNFMHNQKVTYSSGNWTYSPIKYWPNGEDGSDLDDYVSFFAYAPHSSDPSASACITDFPLPIEMGDPWLIYRLADDVASQVDLLFATPVLDKTKPADNATDEQKKVNFKFKHALACVGDKVSTSISEELGNLLKTEVADKASLTQIDVILRKVSIVYTLTQKGKLSLASSTALWKPVMSGEFTTKRTVTVFDSSTDGDPQTLATITGEVAANEYSVSDKGVFYIPLQVGNEPQQATCTIDYTIRRTISGTPTPTDFNGSTTKTVNLREAGGEIAGAHLNLELQLSDQISVKGKSLASFYMQAANKVYTGSAITTEVTISDGNTVLREGTDYTLSYENNTNVGIATVTATGMGDYDPESSISTTFLISPRHIKDVSVAAISDETYDNTPKTPTVTVTDGGNALTLGTHYTVSYSNNTNAGTANVTITGIGNYTGSRIEHFTIGKISPSLSISPSTLSWTGSDTDSKDITVTTNSDGTISAEVTSGECVTVSTSGTTVTVSPNTSVPGGIATITITVEEGTNYTTRSTTCDVTVGSTLARLKAWCDGGSGTTTTSTFLGWYIDASGNISSTNNSAIGRITYYRKSNVVDENISGSRIMVMALTDASEGCQWKTNTTLETEFQDVRDDGYASTNAKKDVLDEGNPRYPAAHAAANYNVDRPEGASTWFLPSSFQLTHMSSKYLFEILGTENIYWTSTPYSTTEPETRTIQMWAWNSPYFRDYNYTDTYHVRACFVY